MRRSINRLAVARYRMVDGDNNVGYNGYDVGYNGYWLCLCGRAHPPDSDICLECHTRQRQGAGITDAVLCGLARDIEVLI